MNPDRPLLIQGDHYIYVDTTHPEYKIVLPVVQEVSDLVKTPSSIHIYKISSHSIWYACEQGIEFQEASRFFHTFSKLQPPSTLMDWMKSQFERYDILKIVLDSRNRMKLVSSKKGLLLSLLPDGGDCLTDGENEYMVFDPSYRGRLKKRLMNEGYPVKDFGGYEQGAGIDISKKEGIRLRPYQKEACDAFMKRSSLDGGAGVVILPCGSGKTMVGIELLTRLRQETLIVTPNDTSLRQWFREVKQHTSVSDEEISMYDSSKKELSPITITTYQMLTHKRSKSGEFSHLKTFRERQWGLVIYDEVHLLPAPLFRFAAELQSTRRLGLTATCVREDGREGDIFSLIGPKRYEAGIKMLEENQWIASPTCKEIRVPFCDVDAKKYWLLSKKEQFRHASENKEKLNVLDHILKKHSRNKVLIIGSYLDQLEMVKAHTGFPLVTGKTPKEERERIFQNFRQSKIRVLILSKVANLALDLPDAEVGIQLSGAFGSRQEEAQRIGRLLRKSEKSDDVTFYTLVTPGTKEEERASNRQLFMIEQGYEYKTEEWG
ncbi:DNA repair helicase XPB [Alteribacter aurantiacus]|uniref:DNA repair helicase XPB n=1 Tax=Alteribacter aurantiacus TaxID=254410 RepID=UPI00146FB63F|nr:DNA repair helicase XPB [Alteribacter aurantiacus]